MVQLILLMFGCPAAEPAGRAGTTDSGVTTSALDTLTGDTSTDDSAASTGAPSTGDPSTGETPAPAPCTIEIMGDAEEPAVAFDLDDVICWTSLTDRDHLTMEFVNTSLVGDWVYMEVTGDVGPAEPRVFTNLYFESDDVFSYWASGADFYSMTRTDGTVFTAAAFRAQTGLYTLVGLPTGSPASIQVRAWICEEQPGTTETTAHYGTPGYGYADDPPQPCYE